MSEKIMRAVPWAALLWMTVVAYGLNAELRELHDAYMDAIWRDCVSTPAPTDPTPEPPEIDNA